MRMIINCNNVADYFNFNKIKGLEFPFRNFAI